MLLLCCLGWLQVLLCLQAPGLEPAGSCSCCVAYCTDTARTRNTGGQQQQQRSMTRQQSRLKTRWTYACHATHRLPQVICSAQYDPAMHAKISTPAAREKHIWLGKLPRNMQSHLYIASLPCYITTQTPQIDCKLLECFNSLLACK